MILNLTDNSESVERIVDILASRGYNYQRNVAAGLGHSSELHDKSGGTAEVWWERASKTAMYWSGVL